VEVIEELAKGGLARLPFGGIAQAQIPKPMLLPRNYAPIVVPKTPPFSPCQVPDCQPSKILVSGVSQTTNAIECFLLLTFLALQPLPCLLRAKPESGGSQRQKPSSLGPVDDG
jgi:hypothetical protein